MRSGSPGPESLRAYRFVEFAARRRPGFRNCLVPVARVPALVRRYGAYGCYATFYLYDDAIRVHARDRSRRGRLSVAGFGGPVYAPVWPLDIDAPDLADALGAARAVGARLTGTWGVPATAVRYYFSGKKGFHLTVDTRAFLAPAPSRVVPELLYRLTRRLAEELGFPASGPLDLSLRDRVRLLRLPNTRHEESGLFKIPLAAAEVLALDIRGVRSLAGAPRPLEGVDPSGLVWEGARELSPGPRRVLEEVAAEAHRPPAPATLSVAPEAAREVLGCPARRALLAIPVPPGQRNNTAIRLASWLREAGWPSETVEERLLNWNRALPVPLDEAEVHHVVSSAFAPARPYRYGCRDPLIEPHCPEESAGLGRCPYHRRGETAP